VFVQYLLVHFDDFFFRNNQSVAIRVSGAAVNKHLSKFADEPAAELDESHLENVLLHGEVDFGD